MSIQHIIAHLSMLMIIFVGRYTKLHQMSDVLVTRELEAVVSLENEAFAKTVQYLIHSFILYLFLIYYFFLFFPLFLSLPCLLTLA